MSEWEVRPATPEDRDAAVSLLARAHAGDVAAPPTRREWDWLFLENTAGVGLQYFVAATDDRLAGQYATLPVRVRLAGHDRVALTSMNTATDPDFQRQGVFVALADRLYRDASERFPFVYGFPNERSAHGLFDRLGWKNLGRVPLMARLLRKPSNLGRARVAIAPLLALLRVRDRASIVAGTRRAEPVETIGDWANDLWATVAPTLGVCAIRDAEFLRWRFVRSPHAYRRWALTSPSGTPIGFAVTRVVDWHGTKIAWLMELLSDPHERFAADRLIDAALGDAVRDGAVALCTPAMPRAPYRGALRRAGFLPIPARFAQTIPFGVRALSDDAAPALDPRQWYLSGADFDWL